MDKTPVVIRNYNNDHLGIGNILKAFITARSLFSNVTIQCYPFYIYGLYDTILDNSVIWKGEEAEEIKSG